MFLYWIFGDEKYGIFEPKSWWKYDICRLLKSSCFDLFWSFQEWEIRPFLIQKVAGKMIFTDYWKVLVLTFSRMGNTVVFLSQKADGKWYLLVAEKFLFWTFRRWKIRPFSAKKLMERWYLLALFELPMIFQDLGNMVFRAVNFVVSRSLFRVKDSPNFWLPN